MTYELAMNYVLRQIKSATGERREELEQIAQSLEDGILTPSEAVQFATEGQPNQQ